MVVQTLFNSYYLDGFNRSVIVNCVLRFLRSYSYAIWLGFSFAVAGIYCTSWEYYFISIPTVLLIGVNLYYSSKDKD